MIVYNTTFHVSDEVEKPFLQWIREQYVPVAVAEGLVSGPQLMRVMGNAHDGGTSYALQLQAENIKTLQKWCLGTGKTLSAQLTAKFGSAVVGFTTMMEKMDI